MNSVIGSAKHFAFKFQKLLFETEWHSGICIVIHNYYEERTIISVNRAEIKNPFKKFQYETFSKNAFSYVRFVLCVRL